MSKDAIKLSASVKMPIDIATEVTGIYGRRGSGKTYTAMLIAEELLEARQPIAVLDPLDVWWGLRSTADGKSAAYPVLIAGNPRTKHCDLPLRECDGAALARFIVDTRVPAILSLRHLSKTKQRQFVADFCETIYEHKADASRRDPLPVFIDEASTFVPQHVTSNSARMVGAIDDLVRRGRSSGIGCILIDQRPATVNKDVSSQVEVLICHQVTNKHDNKALTEWVELHDEHGRGPEFLKSLAALNKGEAWVWSPAWLGIFERASIKTRRTFDSSNTPKAGERKHTPRKLADVNLDAIKAELAASIEQARSDDPKALKQRIAELERAAGKGQASAEQIAQAEARGRAELAAAVAPIIESIEMSLRERKARHEQMAALANTLSEQADRHRTIEEAIIAISGILLKTPKAPGRHNTKPKPPPAPGNTGTAPAAPNGDVTPAQQAILDALAKFPQGADVRRASVVSGRSHRSSTFKEAWRQLSKAGLIEQRGGSWTVTDAGIPHANYEPLPTGAALVEEWKRRLNPTEAATLDALVAAHPAALDRDAIAAAAGRSPKSSTFKEAVRGLIKLGLAVDDGDGGAVRAADDLATARNGGGG